MRSPLEKVRKEEPSPAAVARVKIQETWIFKKGEKVIIFNLRHTDDKTYHCDCDQMDARWENATNGYLEIIYSVAFKWKIIFSPFQTRQYCLAGLMNNLTRGLVVLQRDHILGPLLQTLQEVDNLQIFLVELKYFSFALCILTRSRMSSALGDWNVNSSLRTVTRVKVWENALLLLK